MSRPRRGHPLYGPPDEEEYSATDPAEAAEAVFDDVPREELEGMIVDIVEVEPIEVTEAELKRIAWCLIEEWDEKWSECFGNPVDETHVHSDEAELIAMLTRWAEKSHVWQCEPTGRRFRYAWDFRADAPVEVVSGDAKEAR